MLSTPPAFILSQDQTLIKSFSRSRINWLILTIRQSQTFYCFLGCFDFRLCCSLELILIANCFAVLNESFKVISLFSYQSSLFVAVQQLLYLIRCSSACQQLFYFSLLSSQATAILDYHRQSSLSTTFFLLPEVFSGSAVASHAACVLTFLLSVPPHQRQLAYNSTAAGRSQHISGGFVEVGHLAVFTAIV